LFDWVARTSSVCREGPCNILGAPNVEHVDIEAERAGCRTDFG
jgi:hypothetical protein